MFPLDTVGYQEIPGAHGPVGLVQFRARAVGEADSVGGVVEGAGCPDRPVQKVEPRVLRVVVGVEQVMHGHFADLQSDARHVLGAGELAVVAIDLFRGAAEAELLAHEETRRVEARIREARFLRLAVGIAAGAKGVGHAEALQQLRIEVELTALPQAHAEKERRRPGLARLAARRQAVGAVVGCAESGIALVDEGRLAVDFEAAGPLVVRRHVLGAVAAVVALAEAIVETETDSMQVVLRIVVRARTELEIGAAEVGIEIFEPRRPVPVERMVDAGTDDEAGAQSACGRVLEAGGEVGPRQACAGPGQAAGHEGRPASHAVPQAPARRREVFELLVRPTGCRRAVGHHLREIHVTGERYVKLYAQHQAGRQVMLVTPLDAAEQLARLVAAAGSAAAGIAQGRGRSAKAVADIAAEVEGRSRLNGVCCRRGKCCCQHGHARAKSPEFIELHRSFRNTPDGLRNFSANYSSFVSGQGVEPTTPIVMD